MTRPDRLPPELAERVRTLSDHPARKSGEFVLLWLHNALRADDNPAASAAVLAANDAGLPLLVYQGLSQRYSFASDRHHTFILEGARDLAAQCADAGLPYALHVERPGHDGPVLRDLALRSALTVTDDMPTEPARQWAESLAARLDADGVPMWAVDAACVVPVTMTDQPYDRAFAFRNKTSKARKARVNSRFELPALDRGLDPAEVAGLRPVDVAAADIADLVGQCEVDHAVGPVPHTRGGTEAGRRRWQTFRDRKLKSYAKTRNNALTDGVSRLSAYFHYGMLSVFEVAREAKAAGEAGRKFLDELLVWRELAYHFCLHTPHYGTLSAVPAWAEDTLLHHARDERPLLPGWERLARGETGDDFWDAAQKSLLVQGELHNNVRMTWGKAVLNWTAGPEEALSTLIDLNNRYALDGRDPSSYGGLLWCLGQFDRPFKPETPVFGLVRPRDTKTHAKRLDPVRYRTHTTRPLADALPSVAVVGGGVAGLMCARTLADHGLSVTVFDRGRTPGGRANVKETDAGPFDHGTPWFTVEDDRLRPYAEAWVHAGVLRRWGVEEAVYDADSPDGRHEGTREVLVGMPTMRTFADHLAEGLDVRASAKVTGLEAGNEVALRLGGEGRKQTEERFGRCVLAMPGPQAARLLGRAESLPDFRPQHVAMAAFDGGLRTPGDWLRFQGDGPLLNAVRESAKPGRGGGERWTITSASDWSASRLEADRDAVAAELVEAFLEAVGGRGVSATFVTGHRWTFSRPNVEDEQVDRREAITAVDADGPVLICGDWEYGTKVEAALLSGMASAGRILRRVLA